MKTLKPGFFAFALFCLFNACTKDSSSLSSVSSTSAELSARESLLGQAGRGGGGSTNEPNNNSTKVVPEMTISFNPDPGVLGQEVTVTGSFVPDANGTTPSCGKLQLMLSTDGTNWTTISQEKTITATDQQVVGSFTPTLAGDDVYQFKLHYVSSGPGCTAYDGGFSGIFRLDVVDCQGLKLTRELTDVADAGNGLYAFTVVYTVSTCGVEFDKLKLQGGLTNATSIVSATPQDDAVKGIDYENWIPGGSKNWIQRWEETSAGGLLPTQERVYTVTFTKAYSGSGPIELTGNWSVTLTKGGVEVDRKECDRVALP